MARLTISPNIANINKTVDALVDYSNYLDEKIDEVASQIPSKMVVSELPEEGDPLITYYVGPKGTSPNEYYEVWVWVQEVPDGPFVWRELEDTDQVDLSGYLPIQDDVTTNPQAYVKLADGTQGMIDTTASATANTIVRRDAVGEIAVPTPTADTSATPKKYVKDNFVEKVTTTDTNQRVYAVAADGTQVMIVASGSNGSAGWIPCRVGQGQINSPAPTNDNQLANRGFNDGRYVMQDTSGVTSYYHIYCKKPDGTQGWINGHTNPLANTIPIYRNNNSLRVGTPTDNDDAATKGYVDVALGLKQKQVYIHETTVNFTIGGVTYGIKLHCLDTVSTAYTTLTGKYLLQLFTDRPYSVTCVSDSSASASDPLPSAMLCVSRKYLDNDDGIGFRLILRDGSILLIDGIDTVYNTSISNVSVVDGVLTLN